MAKITIILEDKFDGNVKVVSDPTFETMAMKAVSGNDPTSAEAYALFCLRMIREQSKSQKEQKFHIPGT